MLLLIDMPQTDDSVII